MQRFVALIALIFAFASLAGTTTAHAHRYQSLPIERLVVLNHVDEANVSIPVFVKVQRCGDIDLGAGIVLPCGPHQGIPVSAPVLPAVSSKEVMPKAGAERAPSHWHANRLLRPPISA